MEKIHHLPGCMKELAQASRFTDPMDLDTEAERMDHLFRIVISKPKAAIDRQEKKWKRSQARKKRAKNSPA